MNVSKSQHRVFSFALSGWALLVCAALVGCDNMQHQRGVNNKVRQPGDERIILRVPPAHTVAQGAALAHDPRNTGFSAGVAVAKIPVPITASLMERGRDRFTIYCAVCHGADGYGQGIVVRRGFPSPPSYHEDRLRGVPDGHLFDVITRGYGVMLPFADRLTPDDRWAVVAYVRALQLSQQIEVNQLSPGDLAQLPPR